MRPKKGTLLDTHVLLWAMAGAENLSKRLVRALSSDAPIYFSAISLVEIEIKSEKGRLPRVENFLPQLRETGLRELPLDSDSASAVTRFASLGNHDPFDRMLVAQAITHSLTFETADQKLLSLGIPGVVDAKGERV